MQIRNDIRQELAVKLDDSQLIAGGESIGKEFDEEFDKARLDGGADVVGSDGGGCGM